MKQLGFGVMVNGKPHGIWPRPLDSALKRAKEEGRGSNVAEVVPIFIGEPISVLAPKKTEDTFS